jgi:Mlc titration factor MtfA (ptsG expression regulator)
MYSIILQKNPYYINLSENGKHKFETRLMEFIKTKHFVGHQNLMVTDEMRILIGATAIQLTFGMDNYLLANLRTINIFPDIFHSRLFNASFKGLTSRNGVLSLSWKHFKSGYINETDKINLGLHEMAHVLNIYLENKNNSDRHFSNHLLAWKKIAVTDFHKLKNGNSPFLRPYGSSNLFEFFAVCVEHFFEMPEEFRRQLPRLYESTAMLLNQDITNTGNDYLLMSEFSFSTTQTANSTTSTRSHTEEFDLLPKDTPIQSFARKNGVTTAIIFTSLGFIGIPILFLFASVTSINTGVLLTLLFLLGLLGLLQWRYVKNHIEMEYHQFTMYAFVGFGICSLNLLLLLNYCTTISYHTQTYPVAREGMYYQLVILNDNDNEGLERVLNNYAKNQALNLIKTQKVTIVFERGLLGFDKISTCTFY